MYIFPTKNPLVFSSYMVQLQEESLKIQFDKAFEIQN